MIFRAYLDDSADRNRERVVVSGTILGTSEQWTMIAKPWRDRLAEDGIEYFKSSHCRTLNGQFHKFRSLPPEEGRTKADKIRDDLDAIIRNSKLGTIGSVIPVPFFKTMKAYPGKFGEVPKLPYQLAFQHNLGECAKMMRLLGRGNIVTFGHDDGDDFPMLHTIYREFKKVNTKHAKVMMDFVPLDDKVHIPVQAADVAAFVTYRYAEDWATNPTTENLKRLRGSMYKIVFFGPEETKDFSSPRSHAKMRYIITH